MANFLMSYPSYLVLTPRGAPDCVVTDVGKAVALFTDEDLAERFCKAKREAFLERGTDLRQFELVGFQHAEAVLATLHKHAAALVEKGVYHVALDPSRGKRVSCIALPKFLEDLKRTL